ncbi:GNAT family N-acetyltransferase [Candidatus Berkiella aquae]|uniref:Aminoglycoside N(6')-acetyltransferase type 1 n=1 Tax=Candidatus Berkiella aquae TaxID=295108 RepID=A0A0Q9Y9I4_9GAMM|nr:GNAT family N-acetyltransferase [Candidatus Berkiella aquae]MCS5712843.1 GNAT family N-acetyltransferase [Candidatus Berkiella aquae]
MSVIPHIRIAALKEEDFPVLHQWLQNKHVREFWDDGDRTLDQVKNHYKPAEGIKRYIFYIGDQPAGYFQSYLVDEENEYCSFLMKNTLGVDFFIGNEDLLNKGYAIHVLSCFIKEYCEETDRILVDPQPSNAKAIHLYKKYGFTQMAEQIIDGRSHIIMAINLRRTVRAIIFNSENSILLMHVSTWPDLENKTNKHRSFWCTLGGRIEKGEPIETALARELYEEGGFTNFQKSELGYGELVLNLNGFPTRLIEIYYAVHVSTNEIITTNLTQEEKEVFKELRWWSLEDLSRTQETVFPGCIADLAASYLKAPSHWQFKEINLD